MEGSSASEAGNTFVDDAIAGIQTFISTDMLRAFLLAAAIVLITGIIVHFVKKLIKRILSIDGVLLPSSSIIVNIVTIVIWALGIGFMLSACFKVDVNGLFTALGVGGIALSLGLQDTLKNFIGGLQVTLLKVVSPGDHVVVGSIEGIVQDVNWRQTVVKDYENVLHMIPNAVINSGGVSKIDPSCLVSSVVVVNNDGRDIDSLLREMELRAKVAVEKVAPLVRDPWILVTQIGDRGIWTKMRFVLEDTSHAREARDAALRAVAPFTRNNAADVLPEGEED